jgi:hypothetical protein
MLYPLLGSEQDVCGDITFFPAGNRLRHLDTGSGPYSLL